MIIPNLKQTCRRSPPCRTISWIQQPDMLDAHTLIQIRTRLDQRQRLFRHDVNANHRRRTHNALQWGIRSKDADIANGALFWRDHNTLTAERRKAPLTPVRVEMRRKYRPQAGLSSLEWIRL